MRLLTQPRAWLVLGSAGLLVATLGATDRAFAAAPTNDDVADAATIPELPFTATVDTSEATVEPAERRCGAATAWYTFTPDDDVRVLFSTDDSDYNTTLAVYRGTPDALTRAARCRDNSSGSTRRNETVLLEATAGTTYYVQAGTSGRATNGQVGPGGHLTLSADVAPPALAIDARVEPHGVATDFGIALARARVACEPDARVGVNLQIRQRQGHRAVTAYSYRRIQCDGDGRTVTFKLSHDEFSFRRKPALVRLYARGCDSFTCDRAGARQVVELGKHF